MRTHYPGQHEDCGPEGSYVWDGQVIAEVTRA